jgi:hypothetical protein
MALEAHNICVVDMHLPTNNLFTLKKQHQDAKSSNIKYSRVLVLREIEQW